MTIQHAAVCAGLMIGGATAALAGPPYLTDDPDPVPYHHFELYTFMTGDWTSGYVNVAGPAMEVNNGVAPNTQLHLIIPDSHVSLDGARASGLGDTEAGVKYRFLTKTLDRPEMATFPLLEAPTGDSSEGLGNGRLWEKIPVWMEKNWGAWTVYGGGGYALNPAPGQKNYSFGGLLVQRTLTSALSLGVEAYFQGAQADQNGDSSIPGTRESSIWNAGGIYNFTPDFSLLFSAGHSFQGEGNSVLYLALYRTWGPGSP